MTRKTTQCWARVLTVLSSAMLFLAPIEYHPFLFTFAAVLGYACVTSPATASFPDTVPSLSS